MRLITRRGLSPRHLTSVGSESPTRLAADKLRKGKHTALHERLEPCLGPGLATVLAPSVSPQTRLSRTETSGAMSSWPMRCIAMMAPTSMALSLR